MNHLHPNLKPNYLHVAFGEEGEPVAHFECAKPELGGAELADILRHTGGRGLKVVDTLTIPRDTDRALDEYNKLLALAECYQRTKINEHYLLRAERLLEAVKYCVQANLHDGAYVTE